MKKTNTNKKQKNSSPENKVVIDLDLENRKYASRTKDFKISGIHFFLTYPNLVKYTGYTHKQARQVMLEVVNNIRKLFPEGSVVSIIVAWEYHKDNGEKGKVPHIHVAFELKPKEGTCDGKWQLKGKKWMEDLDAVIGKHGNYRGCKDWQKSVNYLTKEGNYLSRGLDLEAIKNALKKKTSIGFEQVAQKVIKKVPTEQLVQEAPGFMMQHLKKVEAFQFLIETLHVPLKEPWFGLEQLLFSAPRAHHQIWNWFKKNLPRREVPLIQFQNGHHSSRPHKQKQLMISGPKNLGKTHLWMTVLFPFLQIYVVPDDGEWYDGYSDKFDLAIFDEFAGQKPIYWMNKWLEGAPLPLRQRSKSPYMKMKNVATIILTNRTKEEIYREVQNDHPITWEAFMERIKYVELQDRLNFKAIVRQPPQTISTQTSSSCTPTQPLSPTVKLGSPSGFQDQDVPEEDEKLAPEQENDRHFINLVSSEEEAAICDDYLQAVHAQRGELLFWDRDDGKDDLSEFSEHSDEEDMQVQVIDDDMVEFQLDDFPPKEGSVDEVEIEQEVNAWARENRDAFTKSFKARKRKRRIRTTSESDSEKENKPPKNDK